MTAESVAKDRGHAAPTQAERLIQHASMAQLFHAPDGTAYADIYIGSHRETWAIRSSGFRCFLTRRYFEQTRGAPSSDALDSALAVIEARARFASPERNVYVRVGACDGRLYLDLADEMWRAVEIDAEGWRVVHHPPVRFRRAAGMQPLPAPVAGGSVDALRTFLNVQTDANLVLVVAWLLASLMRRSNRRQQIIPRDAIGQHADGIWRRRTMHRPRTVRAKPLITNDETDADGADAKNRPIFWTAQRRAPVVRLPRL